MKADALFNEGNALLTANDQAGACAKFRESQSLDPAPGTAFNIGACEFNQGHFTESARWYRTSAKLYGREDTRSVGAEQKAEDAATHVLTLTLRLGPMAPEGTAVELDGKPVSPQDLADPMFVEPGAHRLRVTAKGYQPRELAVDGRAGEKREITITPGAPEAPVSVPVKGPVVEPSAPRPEAPSWTPSRFVSQHKVSLSLAGAGLVLVGAAYAVGGDIIGGRYHDFVQSCQAGATCDPKQKQAIVDRQIAANVLAGTAAAAAITGVVLFFAAEDGFHPRPQPKVSASLGLGGATLRLTY